jgi:spore germination cell wall hydrolase CwlJ-like protein
VRPRWSRVFTNTTRIGVHVFYRDDRYRTALSN